ncbi:transposase [Streptomyces lydicus]|uniref:transposase n=1 Tax=Streptomyces lydicus TaxID=47763 RepID=UPI0037B8D9D2
MVGHGGVIRRHELSDPDWEFVRLLLPESSRGRERLDDRTVLNGIVWKFRPGTASRDVPERYGPWATLHTRRRLPTSPGNHSLISFDQSASLIGGPPWADPGRLRRGQVFPGPSCGPPPTTRPARSSSDPYQWM